MSDELYVRGDRMLQLVPDDVANPFTSMGYIPKIVFEEGHYNLNYYIVRYDCSIRYADFYVGELLKHIKDNTLVILSADHGESLGEHRSYFAHEENIYDEVLHVPLIIKDNRYFKGGKKVDTIASSVDILPTIMRRIRPVWYFFNKRRFDGVDLKSVLDGKGEGRRYIYSFSPWSWSIRDVKSNIKYFINAGLKESLYFLPDEHTNRIDDKAPDSVRAKKELKTALRLWRENNPVRADINAVVVELSGQDKAILKSLGYMK